MHYDINTILKEEYDAICFLLDRVKSLDEHKGDRDDGYKLHVRNNDSGPVYYKKYSNCGHRESITLGSEDDPEVIAMKQAKYNETLIKKLEKNKAILERVIGKFENYDPDSIDSSMPEVYVDATGLVNKDPGIMSADEWAQAPYKKNDIPIPDDCNIASDGTRVRSKSEVIIHDQLRFLGIPFRYDADIKLTNEAGERVYKNADFVIKQASNDKPIILEHLGRLDDERYFHNAIHKLRLYIRNGFDLNDHLYITADSTTGKINAYETMQLIKKLIQPKTRE